MGVSFCCVHGSNYPSSYPNMEKPISLLNKQFLAHSDSSNWEFAHVLPAGKVVVTFLPHHL